MQKNILQKQKKHQNIIPRKEFTGKNLTRFGGVGLFRRFFEKMDLKTALAVVGILKPSKVKPIMVYCFHEMQKKI